jgi:hypothetical protein
MEGNTASQALQLKGQTKSLDIDSSLVQTNGQAGKASSRGHGSCQQQPRPAGLRAEEDVVLGIFTK